MPFDPALGLFIVSGVDVVLVGGLGWLAKGVAGNQRTKDEVEALKIDIHESRGENKALAQAVAQMNGAVIELRTDVKYIREAMARLERK